MVLIHICNIQNDWFKWCIVKCVCILQICSCPLMLLSCPIDYHNGPNVYDRGEGKDFPLSRLALSSHCCVRTERKTNQIYPRRKERGCQCTVTGRREGSDTCGSSQDKWMSCPIRGEGSLIKETSDFLEIKFANKLIRVQVWVCFRWFVSDASFRSSDDRKSWK